MRELFPFGIGIGIGMSRLFPFGTGGGSPSYDPDAQALFDRMTVQPDADRKALISGAFIAGKAKTWWAKMDALYFLAAHNAQAGLLNWLSATHDLLQVNSPAFVVDRGYSGDGVISWVNSQFVPNTASGKMKADNLHMSMFRGDLEGVAPVLLAGFSHNSARTVGINPHNASSRLQVAMNGTIIQSTVSTVIPTGPSFFMGSTAGAGAAYIFQDGVSVLDGTPTTNATLPAEALGIGRSGLTIFRSGQVRFWSFGGEITKAEALDLETWVRSYLSAIGATV